MPKKYRKLKSHLFEKDINQVMLSKKLGRSTYYTSQRMNGKLPFTQDDIYIICDYASIPYEKIHLYFPRGGVGVNAD